MSTTKPEPSEQPEDEPDVPPVEIEIPIEPGKTTASFDVPEGTRNVTINIDPALLGRSGGGPPQENSFQSCSRSCGGVVLSCLGVFFVVWLIGALFAR